MRADRFNRKATEQLNMFEKPRTEGNGFGGQAPLAERMRPRVAEEFVGQSHLLGPGRILDRLLKNRQFHSLILWGPPGCGKTTLAKIIVNHTESHTIFLSAVMAGAREIREAAREAKDVFLKSKMRTWLLMDEIHRLNKAQQDTLLPHIEDGTLLLLGATTENPSFEIIRPLLSRSGVVVLEPLDHADLKKIMSRALGDEQRGLGKFPVRLGQDAVDYLIAGSGGDARVMLNGLEIAVLTTAPDARGVRTVELETAREALQRKSVHYDKAGDEHFNLISALHKSVRGSDPDAALYWLARMLEGGEDQLYIGRRILRMACEDIGLADPAGMVQAVNALQAYHFLGSPEGELALAQAVVYLCLAPKSNSLYTALGSAGKAAANSGALGVPAHLRNAPTELMKNLGYGQNYKYAHDFEGGWVPEVYLPEELSGTVFYEPKAGWETRFSDQLHQRRSRVSDLATGKKGQEK